MYIIVGANGYLGTYMIKNVLEKTSEEILALARHPGSTDNPRVTWVACDISNPQDVERLNADYLQKSKTNKVVYLAAYHNPDLVEKNPRIAWDVNVTSLSRFLNIAENVESLFYPSSDSVYGESVDGKVFTESDELHPVNRYGVQKTVAEKLVTGYGYNVVRFPFLIAPSLVPGKPHFYDRIVESLQNGEQVEMFSDSCRSAVSFDQAAGITVDLMERGGVNVPQILNVCGDKHYSKYDIGLMIAKKLGVSEDLVKAISVKTSNGIFDAKRAQSSLMSNALVKQTLGLDHIDLVI